MDHRQASICKLQAHKSSFQAWKCVSFGFALFALVLLGTKLHEVSTDLQLLLGIDRLLWLSTNQNGSTAAVSWPAMALDTLGSLNETGVAMNETLSSSNNSSMLMSHMQVSLSRELTGAQLLHTEVEAFAAEFRSAKSTLSLSSLLVSVYIVSWILMALAINDARISNDVSLRNIVLLSVFGAIDLASSTGFIMVRLIMYSVKNNSFAASILSSAALKDTHTKLSADQLTAFTALRLIAMRSCSAYVDIYVSTIVALLTVLRLYATLRALTYYRRLRRFNDQILHQQLNDTNSAITIDPNYMGPHTDRKPLWPTSGSTGGTVADTVHRSLQQLISGSAPPTHLSGAGHFSPVPVGHNNHHDFHRFATMVSQAANPFHAGAHAQPIPSGATISSQRHQQLAAHNEPQPSKPIMIQLGASSRSQTRHHHHHQPSAQQAVAPKKTNRSAPSLLILSKPPQQQPLPQQPTTTNNSSTKPIEHRSSTLVKPVARRRHIPMHPIKTIDSNNNTHNNNDHDNDDESAPNILLVNGRTHKLVQQVAPEVTASDLQGSSLDAGFESEPPTNNSGAAHRRRRSLLLPAGSLVRDSRSFTTQPKLSGTIRGANGKTYALLSAAQLDKLSRQHHAASKPEGGVPATYRIVGRYRQMRKGVADADSALAAESASPSSSSSSVAGLSLAEDSDIGQQQQQQQPHNSLPQRATMRQTEEFLAMETTETSEHFPIGKYYYAQA